MTTLYLSAAHKVLDCINPIPDHCLASIHIGDNRPNIANECCKDQHTKHEVKGDKHILNIVDW